WPIRPVDAACGAADGVVGLDASLVVQLVASSCIIPDFLPRVALGDAYPARVVKLVDAGDSKSPAARRAGSIPAPGTILKVRLFPRLLLQVSESESISILTKRRTTTVQLLAGQAIIHPSNLIQEKAGNGSSHSAAAPVP